ncbi:MULTISPECIES: restriction endonuclease subunit S [Actibacterium]|jgi:type I restriction enzyme, S subunit|uniref:Type I restriction enzyme S subunit n=1 Tax=Actibacterium naphthalenivorans TaxID=1614693 RepID=A0A840CFX0_9RHOB|nr:MULTISPECIES: restriction endonuclease subunit S [Actibacterium]MBB4023713.1 type I restriction enzyme S subunit [Actibacterium naphthalenivorans]|tara:strand:+ start:1356 stop:2588 length:1233 start_codon:yes stop_codon:yes gene_type:complete
MTEMQVISGTALPIGWKHIPLKHNLRRLSEKSKKGGKVVALENIESWTGRAIETESVFDGDGVDFRRGDILFGKLRPYLAKVYLAENAGEAVGDLWALRPQDHIEPRFAAYQLLEPGFIDRVNGSTTGAKMPRAEWGFVGSIKVPTPPIETQTAIARFLDRETGLIDGLIEKKTRFIALLKEKEKAAISRFVRRGLDRNTLTIDSGVDWRGRVPAHWVRGRMKDHFRQEKRQGYETLTVLSVYREFGVIEKSSRDDNINKTPEDLTKYQLVKPNNLVINKMKAWQGSMGIAQMRGITSPDYVVMRPIGEHDPRYMHHYLRAQPMPWVYRLISNGIRTDQWRMEAEKFLGLPVFMPPIEEQRRIADRIDVELERIRSLITLTERSIDLLREKRSALITAAVTGKIDVRAAA